jgi:hypothetical protein
MARKSTTSGSKANRSNANPEQTSGGTPASVPDVQKVVPKEVQKDVQKHVQTVPAETAPVAAKPEPKIVTEPRKKLEVVKTEPRRVVPINIEDEIRRRAYELYQQRGAAPGSEREDWLAAEREVRQSYHQQQTA